VVYVFGNGWTWKMNGPIGIGTPLA
jgi:hypothetical protein